MEETTTDFTMVNDNQYHIESNKRFRRRKKPRLEEQKENLDDDDDIVVRNQILKY